ncbi:MAG: sensor histidine kinase, partial [Bacteroidota bacterium]
ATVTKILGDCTSFMAWMAFLTKLVTVASEGSQVKISVADNGVGIADEVKEKIFEPKFTTKTSGMGLGLGMVKNIVENYHGTIDFTSQVGKGTVFTVKFPKEVKAV